MTDEKKKELKDIISKIKPNGGTDIAKGMSLAYNMIQNRNDIGNVTSVFLLSDGLDDEADAKVKVLTRQVEKQKFTINTFGFGNDHDPKLMKDISNLMDGNFYFIQHIDKLSETFIDALASLFSVVA